MDGRACETTARKLHRCVKSLSGKDRWAFTRVSGHHSTVAEGCSAYGRCTLSRRFSVRMYCDALIRALLIVPTKLTYGIQRRDRLLHPRLDGSDQREHCERQVEDGVSMLCVPAWHRQGPL
jgi:hypothetical protein